MFEKSNETSETRFSQPSEREIVWEREFAAPPARVFDAWTDPAQFAKWWGPRGFSNPVCELDVREGGKWRVVQRAPDGSEHPFSGAYREIRKPSRLVFTQRYDVKPWDAEAVVTVTVDDIGAGRSRVRSHAAYAKKEDLEGHLSHGMKEGTISTLDRLDEHLRSRE